MNTWGKASLRIPDERRKNQYAHRSHSELCQDVSRAFDQIYLQKWVIRALCAAVTAEFCLVKWLATELVDCIQGAHSAIALLR
jgi:hypothetical protein